MQLKTLSELQMLNKLKILSAILLAAVLTGCACTHTHRNGRNPDHGPNPTSLDAFFCVLDYLLFPPPPVVVAPPPPPPPRPVVVVAPKNADMIMGLMATPIPQKQCSQFRCFAL